MRRSLPGGAFGGRWLGAAVLIGLVVVALLNDGGERDGTGADPATGVAAGERVQAEVLRVVDGDTIEVALGGRTEDLRLIGVDTPETVKPGAPVDCFGPEASEFSKRLLSGEQVELRFDRELRDRYDRLLAYVYLDDTFVNAELIRGGYARTLEIAPNTSEAEQLGRLEQAAGEAGAGLWSAC